MRENIVIRIFKNLSAGCIVMIFILDNQNYEITILKLITSTITMEAAV